MIRLNPVLISLILLTICTETYAQNFKLNNEQSNLQVKGISSLHNWQIKADSLSGKAVFDIKSGALKGISALILTVIVNDLKGEKKGITKKMRSTLSAQKYKTINYHFTKLVDIYKIDSHHFSVKSIGILTITGFSKQIDLLLNFEILKSSVKISGKKNIKMTDFNLKPPKALMGILKTGDEVSVLFDVLYQ